jgi:hypothetical protein
MVLPELKVKFICGISNGESLIEDEGILKRIKGEDSPWLKLQKYLKDNDLKITSMSLKSKTDVGNRHYHLPNQKPKFKGEVPIGYNCFRHFANDVLMGGGNIEHYTCMEAIYPDYRVRLYVSETDPDKCWVNVVSKETLEQRDRMSMTLAENEDEKKSQ